MAQLKMHKSSIRKISGFWERVDKLRGSISLKELADKTEIKYTRIRDGRSLGRVPGINDALKISNALGTNVNYLISGKEDLNLTSEMIYVGNSDTARLLIRYIMNEPILLEHFLAIAELCNNKHGK